MLRQISVYSILLLALIALTFFLSARYISKEPNEIEQRDLNIFQAQDINLKLNFFESDLDISMTSKMINGLSESKILNIFNPQIKLKNSEMEVEITSKNSELNYGKEELFIPNKINFNGKYLNKPFFGEADQMKFNFAENRIFFDKNFKLIFDNKEYKGESIEINTKLKSIVGNDKISIKQINDLKSK